MATSRPFAYNTGSTINGTEQIGDLAIGTPTSGFTLNPRFWNGPDEELGYVIAHTTPSGNQPNPLSVPAYVGFWRSTTLTDGSFINLAEYVSNYNNTPQTFLSATEASIWLTNNGFWNSYVSPVLYLDAGNSLSYPGTGTTWTDIVSGRTFNLINGPGYDPNDGGKIYFYAPGGQYAECSSSLPNLNTWSVGVWHYYTGNNSSGSPCIVTEVYPGNTYKINYVIGNTSDSSPWLQTGFFNSGWWSTPTGVFQLTPNNWYYIVGTYDGTDVKLYVNNTLIDSGPHVDLAISSQGGIRLMRRWDVTQYWDGYLSTVGIYDRALDSNQISSIWNTTKSRYGL